MYLTYWSPTIANLYWNEIGRINNRDLEVMVRAGLLLQPSPSYYLNTFFLAGRRRLPGTHLLRLRRSQPGSLGNAGADWQPYRQAALSLPGQAASGTDQRRSAAPLHPVLLPPRTTRSAPNMPSPICLAHTWMCNRPARKRCSRAMRRATRPSCSGGHSTCASRWSRRWRTTSPRAAWSSATPPPRSRSRAPSKPRWTWRWATRRATRTPTIRVSAVRESRTICTPTGSRSCARPWSRMLSLGPIAPIRL